MINKDTLSVNTNKNNNLYELSIERPVLLVFLRQFGCLYCRESLSDISSLLSEIESRNIKLVLVHMSEYDLANTYLEKYQLDKEEQISDPLCSLYAKFGLVKGSVGQLFGLKVWARGFGQAIKGNFYSLRQIGDALQMPGLFVLHKGKVENMFIHNSIADRPNYLKMMDDVIENLK